MRFLFVILLFFTKFNWCFSQIQPNSIKYYYPKDSLKFKKENSYLEFEYDKLLYGKTTIIIHCEMNNKVFDFIFKKNIRKLSNYGGNYSDVYGIQKNGNYGVVEKYYNEPFTISEHNLYAFIIENKNNVLIKKITFQDFGNEVFWPEFDYSNCSISDENQDGMPEFYLSYMCESDGLDAKPFKQIIYTFDTKNQTKLIKSKTTAYYSAGNEGETYKTESDFNWNKLPKLIRFKSKLILNKHKILYFKNQN